MSIDSVVLIKVLRMKLLSYEAERDSFNVFRLAQEQSVIIIRRNFSWQMNYNFESAYMYVLYTQFLKDMGSNPTDPVNGVLLLSNF